MLESTSSCDNLGIPGSWISSRELDLSLPFTTPPGSFLLGSPLNTPACPSPVVSPPSRSRAQSTVSKPSMSHLDRVVRFHRRLSTSLFPSQEVTLRSPAQGCNPPTDSITPQSLPSLLDSCSTATTPSPATRSPDLPPVLPPLHFPPPSVSDDALSLCSQVTRLSFAPSIPFSPESQFDSGSIVDPDWVFSSPAYQHNQLHHSYSRASLDSSIIDRFPSSASIKPIPSIPSISSAFRLNNFPSTCSSTVSFDPGSNEYTESMPSFSVTRPVISTLPSTNSSTDQSIPSAWQAHRDMPRMNPEGSSRIARILVRDSIQVGNEDGGRRLKTQSWAYACHTVPYDAGFRPHVYVDNSGCSLRGKRGDDCNSVMRGEVNADLLTPSEANIHKPKKVASKFMRKFRGRFARLMDSRESPKKFVLVDGKENVVPFLPHLSPPQSNDVQSTTYYGSDDGTATERRSPVTTPKLSRDRTSKRFSLPRPLSLFVVPRPKMELTGTSYQEPCLLEESFEAVVPPTPSSCAGRSYNIPSHLPIETSRDKVINAKNRRKLSWFDVAPAGLVSKLSPRDL